MRPPMFSVVITTYNREEIVARCLDSCLKQTFGDFEAVVVDDASTDDTLAVLRGYDDPRVRIVAHEHNRGINPARHTGVSEARGEWTIVVDSDWELFPNTLERLAEIIGGLPSDTRVVRSQLVWDNGLITPSSMPEGRVDYAERIAWVERDGPQDAGRCIKRVVFDRTPYVADRRGAMEPLFELDLARNETTVCIEEVLGMEHTDAPNSWLRSVNAGELIPRLLQEAPDMLWMAENTLERHGAALREHGPTWYATMLRVAAMQCFLLSRRRTGVRYAARALRRRPLDPLVWATLVFGMVGPRALARSVLAFRRLRER